MNFHEEQTLLRQRGKKALLVCLVLTFTFMLAEVAGGLWSGSIALLADAAHMLTDFFALSFALFAFRIAEKPPTLKMSYGFHRMEILAALANGVILLNVIVFIVLEVFKRMLTPVHVQSGVMLLFAGLGLLVNLVSMRILKGTIGGNLNLQGAFFHVFSDMLGSLGVLAAGFCIRFLNWPYMDSLAGFLIAGLIAVGAWRLLRDSVAVLLEAAPSHIDLEQLENCLHEVKGVKDIHDLHVWTISSGKESLSAHLDIEKQANTDNILREVNRILEEKFRIFHSTIQLETVTHSEHQEHF